MNQFGVASLITRTNNDVFQIMMFLNVDLRTALLTPIMIIVSFTLTICSSFSLSLIIASTVPLIILGVVIIGKVSGPLSDRQQGSLESGLTNLPGKSDRNPSDPVLLITIPTSRNVLMRKTVIL